LAKNVVANERQHVSKKFYRKRDLAERYSASTRTIDRMKIDGRLPPPDLFLGPFPLWSNETIEANERAAALRVPASKTVSPNAV
jgi:hypothetical protein